MHGIKKFVFLTYFFSVTAFAFEHMPGFETSEHTSAGDSVKLTIDASIPSSSHYLLHLPNDISLTYGQLVSLGDFYGVVGQPISKGKTLEERKNLFLAAFNSFAKNNVKTELEKILAVAEEEMKAVNDGMQQGQKPEDIYSKMNDENNRRWNCITGGDCSSSWWKRPGRYLKLTAEDFSHFGNEAILAYQAGHAAALDEAKLARETHDPAKLEIAYAMNAFASHFLSDRFASGHIRTPRTELYQSVTPGVIGSLLSSYMHNEENHFGLHVHNGRGDHWIAFGDKNYFDQSNDFNRQLLGKALQASADEVFSVYQSLPTKDDVLQFIPEADEIGSEAVNDIASLFFWDPISHKVFRRQNVADVYNYSWTTRWWGWTTLILLSKNKGLPRELQTQLLHSSLREKALKEGLITLST